MKAIACDLVLLTCGSLEALRPCVESLLATTDVPSRLIIVDNDSGKETKDYLRSLRGNDLVTIEIVTNERNEGFVLGMNRGMKMSTAPYVALLNDDLIFTPGWLGRILEAGERQPQIGILNPSSNTFSDHPPKGWTVAQYAEERKRLYSGKVVRVATASGFCMIIKRDLIQKIGYLDEAFIPIFFEDTDYSCRAQAIGYHSAIVKDAYVYHHEHRSFFRIKKQSEVYKKNESTFTKKWGRSLRILAPLYPDPKGGDAFQKQLKVLSEWAFQRCFLYVPLRTANSLSLEERSGVTFFPFPLSPFFNFYCAYRVLRRFKKPIDCLFFFDVLSVDPIFRSVGLFFNLPIFALDRETLVVMKGSQMERIAPFHLSEFPSLVRRQLL